MSRGELGSGSDEVALPNGDEMVDLNAAFRVVPVACQLEAVVASEQ
jgi:hypothetical protein